MARIVMRCAGSGSSINSWMGVCVVGADIMLRVTENGPSIVTKLLGPNR